MHYYISMEKCYKMAIYCLFYLLKSLEVFDAFLLFLNCSKPKMFLFST